MIPLVGLLNFIQFAAAATVLVIVHRPGGAEVVLNPNEVTSMYAASPENKAELFNDGVKCVINMTDGKFIGAVETCHDIVNQAIKERQRIDAERKAP
jgi:hypothetical protein